MAHDISGQRFGRLTAIQRDEADKYRRWLCRCDCGAQKLINPGNLRNGMTQSCGCLHRERTRATNSRHGFAPIDQSARIPEYAVWKTMRQRCSNPKQISFPNYGGRGIKVCARWDDFPTFLSDMGRRPSPNHTIERRDNDGDYRPENCYWATRSEQMQNRRPFVHKRNRRPSNPEI